CRFMCGKRSAGCKGSSFGGIGGGGFGFLGLSGMWFAFPRGRVVWE
ncbi:hypothetical protein A2U01_0075639, partial [Trifolium medium]|nr:hypothetical protein [Trifolium medium]